MLTPRLETGVSEAVSTHRDGSPSQPASDTAAEPLGDPMGLWELLKAIRNYLREILKAVQAIEKAVTYRLPRPAPIQLADIKIFAEGKEGNVSTIIYKVTLKEVEDTPANKDVITRKIVTVVDGAEAGSQEVPRDVTEVAVRVAKGSSFLLRGSYVDDDGNEGNSTDSASMVAADTIKPDAPGADFATIEPIGESDE